jgi:hypothetical protein
MARGMKSSTLSLALGALLFLSLGAKLLANRAVPDSDPQLYADRAQALLRADGFETRLDKRPFGLLVHGARPGCRILIGDYSPYGTFAEVFRKHANEVGPLRFAWRGRLWNEAPKLLPLAEFYLRREMLRIGMPMDRRPVTAVAASPGCAPPDLGPLAALPA